MSTHKIGDKSSYLSIIIKIISEPRIIAVLIEIMSRVIRKPVFCIYENTKVQISSVVTVQLISTFVFAT